MKIIYIFLALCFCFVGCKDKPDPTDMLATSPMISEIRTNSKLQTEFVYNGENKVIEIRKYYDDGKSIWESRRYTYSGPQVIREEFWSSHPLYLSTWPAPGKPLTLQSVTGYEYVPNQLSPVKELHYAADGQKLLSYTVHTYSLTGRKIKSVTFTPDGQERLTYLYEHDNRGNVTQWASSYWEYDAHANPFQKLQVPYIDPSWKSPNNATENFGKDLNGTKNNVWRYEYTYDAKSDFPITMKTFVDNKLTSQSEFIYR